ncbi:mannose-1-phosphate guanylyltransferase/mannose-6-phosphate isomerase [Candidatus Falkowbacteria bacterium]|jgi:mannose-1-phosphate guanylyltransferase / mannose-6-phosphate isomerase|nr:mannose-1-phosphate guanylyltransferase/mannose-6-phosphate isomerase [Candidatus Falkowbacteria bacterium]MBT4433330.1 mannose-1-phosphate guanylyltransferase/mannose-6-phosphate isomerase [Candidatus Falkowbacteria bacterium]
MYSLILCGGSGTRLWPLSRKNFPKQFLNLFNNHSLLQGTFLRAQKTTPTEKIFFITNKDNFFNVYNQLQELDKDFDKKQIIIESTNLNTAPAVTLAVKYLVETIKVDPEEIVTVLPADHYIEDEEKYKNLLLEAEKNIGDNIGTVGITVLKPHTGFGYIKKGENQNIFYNVSEFKEKPDKLTAKKYLESREYLWNSGIYLFKIKTFVNELNKHAPELYSLLSKNFETFLNEFKNLPSISFDHAISEKSNKIIVFEGDFGWNDIGSFDSLMEILSKNKNYKPNQINIDSKNISVLSTNNRLVTTIGVEDLGIVENNDSILIYKKGRSEKVKKIVEQMQKQNIKEIDHVLINYRPWGKYEILIENLNHKVKKITVYPGEKLSLQSHLHRAEHWIVIKGVAKIVNNDREIILDERESTFIPTKTRHRLENPGKINLEIIEVQTGNYLEEDDIIRYDDIYER